MPSIRYINQSAPFWDFVASLEDQGPSHPFFTAYSGGDREQGSDSDFPWASWGWGHPAHRGGRRHGPRHGPPHHGHHEGHHSPPPPPPQGDDHPAPPPEGEAPPGAPPQERPHSPPPHHEGGPHQRRGCAGRRGGHRGMHRGGWGGPHSGPTGMGPGGPLDLSALASFFGSHLFGEQQQYQPRDAATGEEAADKKEDTTRNDDFQPEADVFDTEAAYVVHVSLPGAKKEDVGVNWDAEKSELSVAGVVYRPGDEELLKCLALDERRVGAFERKVRLGSRANPAQVDAEGISAKLDDGVLRVEVPKLDKDYVEIRKVDIE